MRVERLDHIVLTVRDPEASSQFYARVLGMEPITFGDGRKGLRFGDQKINLHSADAPISPHAAHPVPGSADICFIVSATVDEILASFHAAGVPVELGPVERRGATGPLISVYFRDPDGNLIEVSQPAQ